MSAVSLIISHQMTTHVYDDQTVVYGSNNIIIKVLQYPRWSILYWFRRKSSKNVFFVSVNEINHIVYVSNNCVTDILYFKKNKVKLLFLDSESSKWSFNTIMNYFICQKTYSWEGTKTFKMYYWVISQFSLLTYFFYKSNEKRISFLNNHSLLGIDFWM